jgi:hypothetical protein
LNEASVTSTLPRTDSLAIHLRQAIANAAIQTDPGPYMVVSNLFPDDVYALLLETMPPPEAFEVADRTKANFDPAGTTDVPAQSRDVWLWFHNDVVDGLLTPALFAAFRSSIASAYRAAFGSVLADEALDLQHRAFQGRLMLRRPGYRLKPHRDKKSATRRASSTSRAPVTAPISAPICIVSRTIRRRPSRRPTIPRRTAREQSSRDPYRSSGTRLWFS